MNQICLLIALIFAVLLMFKFRSERIDFAWAVGAFYILSILVGGFVGHLPIFHVN